MTIEIMTEASETMAAAVANTIATANRARASVVLTTNATGIPAKTNGAVNPAADIRPEWAAITSRLAETMAANGTGTIESMAVNEIPDMAVPDPDTARKDVD
jgi:flagellar hook-length control protein FliK